MAQIDNIERIAFSTQFPIDKIVGYYQGNFNIAAATTSGSFDVNSSASISITHGLGYRPLTDGLWSIDNTNFYPLGVQIITDIGNLTTASTFDALFTAETSSSTTIQIKAYSSDQAARTIYYKIWLIFPDD